MRKRAYVYSREMVWRSVAQGYMASFAQARADRTRQPRALFADASPEKYLDQLPALKLDHLHRLTDETGMLQHATFAVPNYNEGYATDDNARALLLAVLIEQLGGTESAGIEKLAARYVGFLGHAFNPENGRFRNFLTYERKWMEAAGSEDSHGRSLWALGTVLGRSCNEALRGAAGRLFEVTIQAAVEFTSPRAWAFAMLGIQEYLDRFPGDREAQRTR